MMAVQLCAVLVAGMVFNAEPITVLAQETTGDKENVSGNDVETERVKEPENADGSESVEEQESTVMEEETQTDNIASGTDWVLDGSGKLTINSDAGMADWCGKRDAYKTQVASVEIKSGVTEIGREAFRECSGLTSVAIPDGITKMDYAAFAHCSSLTSITIPNSVTEIGDAVFFKCSGLTNIVIPESVTEIGMEAFNDCDGLTSVVIPKGVTSIKRLTFAYCDNLESIVIPDGVTDIGLFAFGYCNNLESIVIPENVRRMEWGAFSGCMRLTKVIVLGETPPSIETEVFQGDRFVYFNMKGIHVPEGKTQIYKEAWTEWENYIVSHTHNMTPTAAIPATCIENGNQAYYICDDCRGWFSDAAGTQKITDKDSVVINMLGHDWGEWVVKTPAAETTPGQKERTCKRCGQTETETIPATGSNPGNGNGVSDNSDNDNGVSDNNDNNNGSNNTNDSNNNNNSSNTNDNSNNNSNNSSNNNDSNNSNTDSNNNNYNSDKNDAKQGPSKNGEPKTGDAVNLELYATIAMIAGFAYLLLYFSDRERGMTEETKKEFVSRIVRWAKQGGKIRKYYALAAIFVLLVYYHSIGKKTIIQYKALYGVNDFK